MKKSFAVAAILSTACLFASVNPASAGPCIFGKDKGITPRNEDSLTSPATQLDTNQVNASDNNLGILGIGMAAVAGLFGAGIVYKVRRAGQEADTALAEIPQEEFLDAIAFPISVPSDALVASISEQDTVDSTADKDLTLVG